MSDVVDRNWYSPESRKKEREESEEILKEMKRLEKEYYETRLRKIERTDFGVRIRYVKKGGNKCQN